MEKRAVLRFLITRALFDTVRNRVIASGTVLAPFREAFHDASEGTELDPKGSTNLAPVRSHRVCSVKPVKSRAYSGKTV